VFSNLTPISKIGRHCRTLRLGEGVGGGLLAFFSLMGTGPPMPGYRDHLLAAALERIPAIEAPPDTPSDSRESPVTAPEGRGDGEVDPEQEKPVSW
jgi:hypothetical protein